jgi:hypothetical protein
VQVSRLGFPLANELFDSIPTLKDQYNRAEPGSDFDVTILQPRLKNPELTNLFKGLFPAAFTTMNLPPQDQRTDLVAAVLLGVPGLNMIGSSPAPADLLRLNTSLGAAKKPGDDGYSALGVLGGDVTGFPNGRRPWDDIVDIELRVAAGVLYKALIAPEGPDFDVAPNNLLADGVDVNDQPFLATFPFLAVPNEGKDTAHAGPVQGDLEVPTATPAATTSTTPATATPQSTTTPATATPQSTTTAATATPQSSGTPATATPQRTATTSANPTRTATVKRSDSDGCQIPAGGGAEAWPLLLPAAFLWWRRRR